jgi:hypothetical protein
MRRVLAFVGGDHDIVDAATASGLAAQAGNANVCLDIVAIGPDVKHMMLLRRLANAGGGTFVEVAKSETVLSDDVLASPIGPGPNSRIQVAEYAKADPEFAQALSLSIEMPKAPPRQSLGMLLETSIPGVRRPRTAKITRVRKPRKENEGDSTGQGNAQTEKK